MWLVPALLYVVGDPALALNVAAAWPAAAAIRIRMPAMQACLPHCIVQPHGPLNVNVHCAAALQRHHSDVPSPTCPRAESHLYTPTAPGRAAICS